MKTMCKTLGGHTSDWDKIGQKQWTSDAKNRKKDEIDTIHKLRRSVIGQSFAVSHRLTTNNNNLT